MLGLGELVIVGLSVMLGVAVPVVVVVVAVLLYRKMDRIAQKVDGIE